MFLKWKKMSTSFKIHLKILINKFKKEKIKLKVFLKMLIKSKCKR